MGNSTLKKSAAISAPVANLILALERFKSSGAEHPAIPDVSSKSGNPGFFTHLRSSTCAEEHRSKSLTACIQGM